jgi:membrane dipeptidase
VTTLVFDGHNDVLLRIHRSGATVDAFRDGIAEGQLDLPRARRGGFGGGLFAVFTPGDDPVDPSPDVTSYALPLSRPVDPGQARVTADALVDLLLGIESAGGLSVVRGVAELEGCLRDRTIGAVLHFEGAEPLATLDDLEQRYEEGLRSLGLVWSRPNRYGEGVPFRFPGDPDTGPGLTPAGRDLVRACNRLGVLVDVSHLNLRGFRDVARLSAAPLVASHSNAHAVCASTRNLLDEQLDLIAGSGGLVGVNFAVGFLRPDGRVNTNTRVDVLVDHFDYLVERMGIDHVAFGSDLDGAQIPAPVGDVGGLPVVLDALRERGYGEDELRKLAHDNWLRILRTTWTS